MSSLQQANPLEHYQYQLEQAEDETGRLAEKVDEDAATLGRYEQRHRGLIADRAAAEVEQKHVDQRRDAQRVVCEEIESEIQSVSEHNAASKAEAQALDQEIIVGRQEIERLELESASVEEMLSESQTALQSATSEVMSISVDLARAEQKVEALNATMQQQKRDQSRRSRCGGGPSSCGRGSATT